MTNSSHRLPTSALLRTAYNDLAARVYASVVSGTKSDDFRPSHGNVMEQLELEDGLRLTDIAARAGIPAKSVAKLVDNLGRKASPGLSQIQSTGAPSAST